MVQRRNKGSRPRFNLDGPTSDKKNPQPIYLIYLYKKDQSGRNIRLKYSTGLLIARRNWDDKRYLAVPGTRLPRPEAELINSQLRLLTDTVVSLVKKNPGLAINKLKNELDQVLGTGRGPKTKSETTVTEYFKIYIDKSLNNERTLQKYRTARKHLLAYEEFLESPILFDDISSEFAERYCHWLYDNTGVKSQNTASKEINTLKGVISDAFDNGYHTNSKYQSSRFSISRVPTTKHYLELKDLTKLSKLDLSHDMVLDQVRDLWLISACTGLRVSDFTRLEKRHIKEVKGGMKYIDQSFYKGRKIKLDDSTVVPLIPLAEDIIIRKYQYSIPNPFPNISIESMTTEMNESIKVIAKLAKLDHIVYGKESIKGKLVEYSTPLYKKISNHTGRFTFINIMLNDYGIPPLALSKITDQTIKTLMHYERGGKFENAKKVLDQVRAAQAKMKTSNEESDN